MQGTPVKPIVYHGLLQRFQKWMETLGYAKTTIYTTKNYARDFLCWLEQQHCCSINHVDFVMINQYYHYLQHRKNKTRQGGLSASYITSNARAIKMLGTYLQKTGQPTFEVNLELPKINVPAKTILTKNEIKTLYQACSYDALGIRDRAMLSIYYGCGLRRSEGQALNVNDILLKENRLFVKKGKNYQQRFVPLTMSIKEDLENYIYVARENTLKVRNVKTEALLLSRRGTRLCSNGLIERIHRLKKIAGISKDFGIHTLRHSIATHLLQAGITLEEVSKFLGHKSLESTQIYTHITNELLPV